MENKPYIVYVRTDDAGNIAAVHSSAFLSDAAGWTEVDSGFGDRYHHAQGNYLPGSIRDERGICRYKLTDGVIAERTQAEMDAEAADLPAAEESGEVLLLEVAADHEYRLCLLELGITESEVTEDDV